MAVLKALSLYLRGWAHALLERCEAIFGLEHCKEMISKHQDAYTLFSGIECARHSWDMIEAAARSRWNVESGLRFQFAVTSI